MNKKLILIISVTAVILCGLLLAFAPKMLLLLERYAETEAPVIINSPPVFTPEIFVTKEIPSHLPFHTALPPPTSEPIARLTSEPTSEPTARLTSEPTSEPTARFTSEPTSEPTAEPTQSWTPEPAPEASPIVFIESKELHLPNLTEELQFGQRFNLSGTVLSEYPLQKVTVKISAENGNDPMCPFVETVTFSNDKFVYEYALEDSETPIEGKSINEIVPFAKFAEGRHSFKLIAANVNTEQVIASTKFNIVSSEWLQLISNNFRNNYSQALKFFGNSERFMFKYKWGEGRNIITDPAWVKKYITSFRGLNEKWWTVHIDAVPYCQSAVHYMENTYIRVRSENHDSGVIQLASLMKTFNGSYVSRFVSDKTFISHHSFGTAIDINAGTKPYNNTTANWKVIKAEAKQLVYDGILEENGQKYYDFTYNGNWAEYHNGVPESVLNYLLYELAFYRAGFGWGYYYPHTCDGMHFTLSELDKSLHENLQTGLRKVFSYYN